MNGPDDVRALPSGTVTLLFADVEGSTRLLHLLGERFAPARARMRELVRAAASDNGGAEVDWAGDGVFLAFSRARDAVAAAAGIQQSLADEPWPDDEPHRLRVGIHTGEPELGPEGYVGIDVVIASRICSASHGEQVVVSQATRDISGDEPLPGTSYRPLGRHRLKDVPSAGAALPARRAWPARGLPTAQDAHGNEPPCAPPSARRPRRSGWLGSRRCSTHNVPGS